VLFTDAKAESFLGGGDVAGALNLLYVNPWRTGRFGRAWEPCAGHYYLGVDFG